MIRTESAATTGPIQAAINEFRLDLGGNDNGTGPATATGRREVTWDDVPDNLATPANLPADYYRASRGLKLSPGPFFVSIDDNPDLVRFENHRAGYAAQFQAYSEQRLFASTTKGIFVQFVAPGTTIPATVKGFGVVFSDVDQAGSTSLEFFGPDGTSLGSVFVPVGAYAFVGVSTKTAYEIGSVFIRNGNANLGAADSVGSDVVVMDDLIYGEPQPPTFEMTVTQATVEEDSETTVLFVVKRLGSSNGQASVELTASGTAQRGKDYQAALTPLTFASGQTERTVAMTMIDDELYEGLETVRYALKNPTAGHVLRSQTGATVLIADDELVPPMAYATTFDNRLIGFRVDNPNAILFDVPITGLGVDERIVGLDHRPADAALFAVTSANRVYQIAAALPTSGVIPVGTGPFTPGLTGLNIQVDIDFDARVDRLRVVSNSGQSLRLNPTTGLVVGGAADAPLAYAAGDPYASKTPRLSGLAYTHSFPGATQAIAYGIDSQTDSLVKVSASNPSQVTTVGPMGIDLIGAPLDIQQGTHFAFAVGRTGHVRSLEYVFLVDLDTGRADFIGSVGSFTATPPSLRTLTIVPSGVLKMTTDRITVNEGQTALVRVERVGGFAGEMHASLEYVAGTARPSEDLEMNGFGTQALVFRDGWNTADPMRVKTIDDTVVEGAEELTIVLVPESRTVVGVPDRATLRIVDNEQQPAISIDDVTIAEGDAGMTLALFTVRLDRPSTGAITVKYATSDDTAMANRDYQPVSGTLTFEPGVLTRTIQVPIIADRIFEGAPKRFAIDLTDSENAIVGASKGTVTITDDDPPSTYYLAEGATSAFFITEILLANPNAVDAPITLTFLTQDGGTVVKTMTLAATSRATVRVSDVPGLEAASVSTVVSSTNGLPIVVERTMRWDASGYGAHTERAVESTSTTWYFAEGSQGFFSTYLLLANPNPTENTATVQYLREGETPVTRTYAMAPNARFTVDASTDTELVNRSFGMIVTFAQPGVAERAMYFGQDPLWKAGHESAGVTAPSTSWFLAEGATGEFFDTFVLLSNPQSTDAEVTLTFLVAGGAPIVKAKTVPASGRLTVYIEAEDPALANVAVGTQVSSSVPVVVERAQYWPFTPDRWYEAHNSFGVTALGQKWGLAEGRTGGADHYQTYVLLANPGTSAAEVTLTFLRTNGTTLTKTVTVAPASRFNVATGPDGLVPELVDEDFGVVIASTQPIAVERAMYIDAGGITWSAGTNATATRLP